MSTGTGAKAGPPGGRLAYERGIRYSNLPAPARHLALTLATWADVETGIIPDRFQPAKETLEQATGLSRGAVFKHLNTLEAEKWISREVGGGRNRRTRFSLRIPFGAKTGHEVTPFEEGNGSRGDLYPRETGHHVTETGHVVNVNGSPRDPKSPSVPEESLSRARVPQQPQESPAGLHEREMEHPQETDDARQVAEAYTQARRIQQLPIGAGSVANVRREAEQLLAEGLPVDWLCDRAREMAPKGWSRLREHCERSTVPVAPAAPKAACERCGGTGRLGEDEQGRPRPCLTCRPWLARTTKPYQHGQPRRDETPIGAAAVSYTHRLERQPR